jgi:hypothetical protein
MSEDAEPYEVEIKKVFEALKAPFPANKIHWRVGATSGDKSSGIALAYIDARDAMERLDEVVGPQNWQAEYPWSDGKRIVCKVGVKVLNEWIWKANGCGDTQVEAEKGAFSDAFKRACVLFGIARYLYDLPNTWVDLEAKGRTHVIKKDAQKQLTDRLEKWQNKLFKIGEDK